MKNMFRFITLSLAVVLSLFLVSCEQDNLSTPGTEVNPISFADAITLQEDGTFTGSLTIDQMSYILENEFGQKVPAGDEEITAAFAQLAIDNAPTGKKPTNEEKSTTYGLFAQVITIPTSGSNIVDFGFAAGLSSGDGPVTASADGFRRQNLTINMSAICYVFTSDGSGSPFFRNDSSADIGTCPGKSFERNLKGEAEVTFNDVGDYEGFAEVKCSRGLIAEAPQEIREN